MKIVRKIIHIDEEKCNGCGQCILSCAEGAIVLQDGKAKVIGDMYCDGLGACMGSCPTDALTIIEREADPFDERAVEELLAAQGQPPFKGCPGSRAESFQPAQLQTGQQTNLQAGQQTACAPVTGMPKTGTGSPLADFQVQGLPAPSKHPQPGQPLPPMNKEQASGITMHWPVKLRLTNPEASYLHGVHLYLAADCSAFAAMNFHSLMNATPTALLTFCPKFESKESIMEKLQAIFTANTILSCTIIRMEVPCCSGMLRYTTDILNELALAGKTIPFTDIILSRKGERVLA